MANSCIIKREILLDHEINWDTLQATRERCGGQGGDLIQCPSASFPRTMGKHTQKAEFGIIYWKIQFMLANTQTQPKWKDFCHAKPYNYQIFEIQIAKLVPIYPHVITNIELGSNKWKMDGTINAQERLTVCRGINLFRKFFYIHLKPHLNLQPSNQRNLDPPTFEQQNNKK